MGASSDNVSKINNNLLNIIIWIDPNIDNSENTKYINELKRFKNIETHTFKDISDSLEKIKTIKFEETHIIVSGSLYSEFIKKLEENIRDIYVVPKIIIFTSSKEQFLNFNEDYKENSFYSLGGIETSFDKIKSFLFNPLSKKDIEDENSLTFEYIDCKEKLILPLFYKSLIEITSKDNIEKYTEHLYKKYSTNNEVDKLLNPIRNIKDIPIELLSKYYARLYTLESKFYEDINKDLKDNKKDNYYNSYYMPYVKILYEGVKLKSLPLASDGVLYRGGKISLEEIIKIKECLKNKLEDLPGAIVFSKSFLSFSKNKFTAEYYKNKQSKNKNLFKVLYTIEKDDNLNYDLSTHSDIENISRYSKEREVLFLPFSSFEIKDLKETIKNGETEYEIKLLYLGKYLKDIENIDDNKSAKIPDSDFKKEIVRLIPKQKMENTKEVIKKFKKYKYIIDNNLKSYDEINIIYNTNNTKDINDKKEIRIFGEKFVENNGDKTKIVIENKEYDLMEYFNINNYIKNKISQLQIKLEDINNIRNMSYMFSNCTSLISLPDISEMNTNYVTDMSYMFRNCSSLSSLPNISKWNTKNVTNMSGMFCDCSSLSSLPDISKWDINNVNDISYMFSKCSSLRSLPDISKWNTINVRNMSDIFYSCLSLKSLPDISRWKTNNVTNMNYMFYGCSSLTSLPDISNWNLNNILTKSNMFWGCNVKPKKFE